MKLRPVLALTDPIRSVLEVLLAYISSVIPAQTLPSDLLIDPAKPEFKSTRLKTVSALRLHKLATIHTSSLARHLGAFDGSVYSVVTGKLKRLLVLQ